MISGPAPIVCMKEIHLVHIFWIGLSLLYQVRMKYSYWSRNLTVTQNEMESSWSPQTNTLGL
jgi:hypothetical protein